MSDVQVQSEEEILAKLAECRSDLTELSAMEVRSAEDSTRIMKLVEDVKIYDTQLAAERAAELRAEAKANATGLASTQGAANGAHGWRSFAEEFINNESVKAIVDAGAFPVGSGNAVAVEMRGIADWETRAPITDFSSTGPGTAYLGAQYDGTNAGALLPLGQPVPPVPRQARLFLRDLIPVMKTGLARIPYVRELGPVALETGATSVAEGSAKPAANLLFQGDEAAPSVIATTLTLSKQLFADAPAVIQYINQRLPYLVRLREDAEFLNGTGNWPDVKGITQYTSSNQVQTQTSPGSSDIATTIGKAIAKVEDVDLAATGVVMNPDDAWSMFTNRASTSGIFDAGTPFAPLPLTVWGLASYRSREYASGTALVGDFQRGAMIVDRESVNMQVYQERYAEQNLVLLVCEERAGLMVPRPDGFVITTV